MPGTTVWDEVLKVLADDVDAEEYRRWFSPTSYASDSGDQITVWVPSEGVRRYLETHFDDVIRAALTDLGRPDTFVRFVVAGFGDDEDEEEEEDS
jgi:chromosomal replication initiation ATPase DnaA